MDVAAPSGALSIPVWNALAGGALIGLSASLLLVLDGRVAGISSILGGIARPHRGDVAWRATFLAGLLAGAGILAWLIPAAVVPRPSTVPLLAVVSAGLLVGFGTQLGGGCTSGHGVCGLSRFSKRSFVAVVTFMTAAAVTTFVVRHVLPAVR
jgi:uncharacterized membrane protein YedE/YeeE